MQIIKRLLFFISIFLFYFVVKEFVSFYAFARSIHPVVGYLALAVLLVFFIYFVMIPIYQIIKIPKYYAPAKSRDKISEVIQKRMENFRSNPVLIESSLNLDELSMDEEGYGKIVDLLQPELKKIRKRYVSQLFYGSSISQNGFLDAILILSSSVNLVKEIFILYQGRVSNKDLLAIARRVYYSMAIGGSEGVEYATEEIFSKFATESLRSIPFADKILSSLADGFVNAALLTRISLITENYCKKIYIESEKELFPSPHFIVTTTRFLVSDITEKLRLELLRMSVEKTGDMLRMATYPVNYLLGKVMGTVIEKEESQETEKRNLLKEITIASNNQISYGISKIMGLFSRKKKYVF